LILTDAGPLIALIERRDRHHDRCVAFARTIRGPLLSTWPAFTEAMYLLGSEAGWRGQHPLWRMVQAQQLILAETSPAMLARMPVLMEQYQDLPMDLADASLVALAEERGILEVFTLDRDFQVYRLPNGATLRVVP
jgi:uncharacterized protein